ncbi:MAG: hypothetical protein IPO97_13240 [Sphingomonadales bacterium]|nr:hypothetical protein [Sphingomonadales bacterium]
MVCATQGPDPCKKVSSIGIAQLRLRQARIDGRCQVFFPHGLGEAMLDGATIINMEFLELRDHWVVTMAITKQAAINTIVASFSVRTRPT